MVWTKDELATMPDTDSAEWDAFMAEQYARLAARAESEGDMFARAVWTDAIRGVADTAITRRTK